MERKYNTEANVKKAAEYFQRKCSLFLRKEGYDVPDIMDDVSTKRIAKHLKKKGLKLILESEIQNNKDGGLVLVDEFKIVKIEGEE